MAKTMKLTEEEHFFDRLYAVGNNILDLIESHPIISLIGFILFAFIILMLIYSAGKKGIVDSIGPFRLGNFKNIPQKLKKGTAPIRITDLPASKPNKPDRELPLIIKNLILDLQKGTKKHVLLQCQNHNQSKELGRLLYSKLNKEKICTHIGWLDYKQAEPGQQVIESAIDREFSIYKDIPDYHARRAKRLDFLDNSNHHIVLFINVEEYCKENDSVLERYNNFKGLSMILMSETQIVGFETYTIAENGGDSL